jgi:Protein of unknown function (DUF3108)
LEYFCLMPQRSYLLPVVVFLFSFSFAIGSIYWSKPPVSAVINCDVSNTAFSSGEEIVYETSYNWGFVWLDAGKVVFNVSKDTYKGISCYKASGTGGTYPSYDWIYKVRDRFECWMDTVSLKPYRYIRDVKEGGRTFYNECYFNYIKGKAYCITKEQKKLPRLDTVPIGYCSCDPLTMIYYSRNADFSKCKVNDTIPISLFLDNKTYSLYLRYLGKDKLKTDNKSTWNCIKFSPLLVEGTVFKGGEGMVVWASDDKNRIPLFVEAPIAIGTVKAKIVSWKGLRNKPEALSAN